MNHLEPSVFTNPSLSLKIAKYPSNITLQQIVDALELGEIPFRPAIERQHPVKFLELVAEFRVHVSHDPRLPFDEDLDFFFV